MKRPAIIGIVAGVAVLAGVAGWFRPMPPATDIAGRHQAQWRLPDQAGLERSTAAPFAATSGVAWFGESGDAGGGGGLAASWTLLGVVGPPGDRAVLVQAGSDPVIKRLHSGDNLPDGSKLVTVGSSGVVIDRDGCRIERPLYPGADAADAADPAGAAEGCRPAGNN